MNTLTRFHSRTNTELILNDGIFAVLVSLSRHLFSFFFLSARPTECLRLKSLKGRSVANAERRLNQKNHMT